MSRCASASLLNPACVWHTCRKDQRLCSQRVPPYSVILSMTINHATSEATLRDRAIKRLKKRRDFHAHLVAYALINAFLVMIWVVTDFGGFFWPLFPLAGWGIAVVLNAWDVYRNDDLDEQRIHHEMERLQREH